MQSTWLQLDSDLCLSINSTQATFHISYTTPEKSSVSRVTPIPDKYHASTERSDIGNLEFDRDLIKIDIGEAITQISQKIQNCLNIYSYGKSSIQKSINFPKFYHLLLFASHFHSQLAVSKFISPLMFSVFSSSNLISCRHLFSLVMIDKFFGRFKN